MQRPDPYQVRATTHPLQNEITQAHSAVGSRESSSAALHSRGDGLEASDRRLMLISPPGLISDCLYNALNECGYDAVLHSLNDPLRVPADGAKLVVISVSSSEADGLAAVRQRGLESRSCLPGVPVMALIERPSPELPRELEDVGLVAVVQGYLSIKIAMAAIHLVMVGGSLMTTKISLNNDQMAALHREDIIEAANVTDDIDLASIGNFTKREIALLTCLRRGMQNKTIAYELGIAESTVKVHLRNIMSKLHANNRTQVVYMLANGSFAASERETLHKLEPITVSENVTEQLSAAADKSIKVPATRLGS